MGVAKIKGLEEAKQDLRTFLRTVETVPRELMETAAIKIEEEAKGLTPYKTGKLEKSVSVHVAVERWRFILLATARAYSKGGTDYAVIQHENLVFNHPIKGQAKYLEEPYRKGIANLIIQLESRVKL